MLSGPIEGGLLIGYHHAVPIRRLSNAEEERTRITQFLQCVTAAWSLPVIRWPRRKPNGKYLSTINNEDVVSGYGDDRTSLAERRYRKV